jgi:hypothetical protein
LEKTAGPPSSPAPSGRHADALNGLETAVLADLNPPLNLDKMPRSPIRERLRETDSNTGSTDQPQHPGERGKHHQLSCAAYPIGDAERAACNCPK